MWYYFFSHLGIIKKPSLYMTFLDNIINISFLTMTLKFPLIRQIPYTFRYFSAIILNIVFIHLKFLR